MSLKFNYVDFCGYSSVFLGLLEGIGFRPDANQAESLQVLLKKTIYSPGSLPAYVLHDDTISGFTPHEHHSDNSIWSALLAVGEMGVRADYFGNNAWHCR